MRFSHSGLTLTLTAILIVGCEQRPDLSGAAPSSAPATAEAAIDELQDQTANLLKSSTSRPAVAASISIAGRDYDFPPVQLLLKSSSSGVSAQLISDDPSNAVDPEYEGNSVFLEMPLIISEDKTLAGARWEFKATSSEREDEINGIYLNGQRRALQPYEAHAEILGDRSPVKIRLAGTFLMFDDQTEDAMPVEINAELTAVVKVQALSK